jgi:chemotaxis protein methyltransferase CheR
MQLSLTVFNEIRKVVHELCGVVITEDKQYLVRARLEPILRSNGLQAYELLVQRLKQPDSVLLQEQIIDAITTKETSFNRDGHPFEELRRSILPMLANEFCQRTAHDRISRPKVRIWCAAVATGQEAYSVAMAVTDFLAARAAADLTLDDFSILASDISESALATAREGRYSSSDVGRGTTAEQRRRFFQHQKGAWIVDASLRRLVEFRRLNLARPLPALGIFDLILCRNVLIYLDNAARRRLCHGLRTALSPTGFLVVGAAESLYGVTDAFATELCGKTVFYRKN